MHTYTQDKKFTHIRTQDRKNLPTHAYTDKKFMHTYTHTHEAFTHTHTHTHTHTDKKYLRHIHTNTKHIVPVIMCLSNRDIYFEGSTAVYSISFHYLTLAESLNGRY